MLPEGPLFHKPKSIVAAKNILYASLFLSIINWVFSQGAPVPTANSRVQGIVTLIITLAVVFILIKQIGFGRKWARVVLLVLFIAGLLFFPWTLSVLFKFNLLVGVISLLLAILQLVALVFLFSKESTQWFNRVQAANQDEPSPAKKQ